MRTDTILTGLRKALPRDHPMVDAVAKELRERDESIDRYKEVVDNSSPELTAAVIDVLEDYKRGIRDWDDVEEVLAEAKEGA